jgi:hypothetical protein
VELVVALLAQHHRLAPSGNHHPLVHWLLSLTLEVFELMDVMYLARSSLPTILALLGV